MLNDRTATVLHLVSVLESQAAYPLGRAGLVRWIERQLDAGTPPQALIEDYPQHLEELAWLDMPDVGREVIDFEPLKAIIHLQVPDDIDELGPVEVSHG